MSEVSPPAPSEDEGQGALSGPGPVDAPSRDDATAVDRSVLISLLAFLGDRAPAAEGRLIDTYLRELPRIVARLQEALPEGDQESLHRGAHTLKSSSANVGALRLSALCAELEARTADVIHGDAAHATAEIARESERVAHALTARRHELPG